MAAEQVAAPLGPRQRPAFTTDDEPFWRSGSDGVLRMQRCGGCGKFQQPPNPVCHRCLSRVLAFEAVGGLGTVYSFTINHQPWLPSLTDPFAVIVVELDEQPGLRFVSRLVDTAVDDVAIGLRVRVVFEAAGEGVFVPLFTSAEAAS